MRVNSVSNTQTQNRQFFGATPVSGAVTRWDAAVQSLNGLEITTREKQLIQRHLDAIKEVMPAKVFSITGGHVYLHDTEYSGGVCIGFINRRLKGAKFISDIRKILRTYARGHKL